MTEGRSTESLMIGEACEEILRLRGVRLRGKAEGVEVIV